MGFAACADWNDAGVCYSLLGVDGSLGHPLPIYFVLLPDISFRCAILCEEPFGLACVAYAGVVV